MKELIVIWMIFVPVFLSAQDEAKHLFSSSRGEVQFISDAPLEMIGASSDELRGLIDPDKRTFAFTIPNNSFKGFNSPLQEEHFYENYIEAEKYPSSTFEGKIIEGVDFSVDGKHTIRAKGILNIHGVKQERVIKVELIILDGTVNANTQFNVALENHDITIPKMVYQKIAENILIKVGLEFIRND